MPEDKKQNTGKKWCSIVSNAPIVSADLVVKHDAGILLGESKKELTSGEWFILEDLLRKEWYVMDN